MEEQYRGGERGGSHTRWERGEDPGGEPEKKRRRI
jgi:hypothetical protein